VQEIVADGGHGVFANRFGRINGPCCKKKKGVNFFAMRAELSLDLWVDE
jgi:hypothetical protein